MTFQSRRYQPLRGYSGARPTASHAASASCCRSNHLQSVHAIALCNAAELAGGMMTEVSIPSGARWIPKGMTVEYLAKAKTSVHAIADGSEIDWESFGDKVVPVDIFDEGGVKVFTARITMNVKAG
ncbi:DUF4442 domain-containing protein [Pseudomonas sp. B21-056]|uniref:hotdog fold domain-containing protein n=1 Tax=Pseudomonas sp. B21-056 TaxID=2895495 RepID=UPI0022309074|nr:hotdog fold domain-containing protein [Pseudomonas sp. B21-056]UZE21774.1 DUF4442 domain-containing protein [Pseudomonas sp. B21-056]